MPQLVMGVHTVEAATAKVPSCFLCHTQQHLHGSAHNSLYRCTGAILHDTVAGPRQKAHNT